MAARKRWSLSVPQDGFTLAEHAALARDAEQWGYEDAWSFESDGLDCFSPLAVIGMATNLRLGTAIANVYTRGPATLAQCAAGVADVAPGRFILGLGSGSQVITGLLQLSGSGNFGVNVGQSAAPGRNLYLVE